MKYVIISSFSTDIIDTVTGPFSHFTDAVAAVDSFVKSKKEEYESEYIKTLFSLDRSSSNEETTLIVAHDNESIKFKWSIFPLNKMN